MKLLTFSAIISFAIAGIYGQEFAVGIPLSSFGTLNVSAIECANNGKTGPQCTADCSTLMMCSTFGNTPLTSTVCSSPTQYCVGGACTATPGPNCTVSGPSFMCTDVGHFPEPSDCTQYRVCEESTAELFQCPKGFNFNSQLKLCQTGFPCAKIDCSRAPANNPFILYSSNPAYYAYCLNYGNGTIQTLMFKCQYEEFEVFDLTTRECQFKCKARGNFQNPASCQEYYYCSAVNAQPILLSCADNYVFDGMGCNKNKDKCAYPPEEPDVTTIDPTTTDVTTIDPTTTDELDASTE